MNMQFLVKSNFAAIILLVILSLSGFITVSRSFIDNFYRKRKRFEVFALPFDKVKNIKNVLASMSVPFTFEIAVSQLGKDKACYMSVSSHRAKKVIEKLEGRKIEDYDLFYPGGVVLGAYAGGEGSLKDINAEVIDFSAINEIGEGAVVQFVFKRKSRNHYIANVRALVSAPSSYQAKEILGRIKSSLHGLKLTDVRNEEFISHINSRVFDSKESVTLSV